MNISNVRNCSFSSWYENFRKVTIKSRIIPLSQEFVEYLLSDGIILPAGSYAEPKYDTNSDDDWGEDEVDWSKANGSEPKAPSFPELEARIKSCIDELGGSVFPKLNWSSPKDARWITANHTLQCGSLGEVFLLLKSSDFITHDLVQPFKNCVDHNDNREGSDSNSEDGPNAVQYELILRKWVDVNPATEFRCFVKDGLLTGICQRDYTNYYEHIVSRQAQIARDILSFFKENISEKFPDSNYVFDVYQVSKDSIRLIDFNPFGVTTDSLLFEWDDLINIKSQPGKMPEFRCVTSYNGIQPSPYRYYAMPVDVLDINTGQDPYKMIDLLQLMNHKGSCALYSSSESEAEAEEGEEAAEENAGAEL